MSLRRLISASGSILLLATAVPSVQASTDPTNKLFGFINSSRTLTRAYPGPIYYVLGDVIVSAGATLTIEPGVIVQFAANHDTLGGGDYPGLSELSVRGALVADAGPSDSIYFRASVFDDSQWGQIRIESGATGTFRHVSIRSALNGIVLLGQGTVTNSSVSASNTGIRADYGCTIDNCVIGDANLGLDAGGGMNTLTSLSISNVLNGANVYGGGTVLRECRIQGRGAYSGGIGLSIGSGVSTAPVDSVAAVPTDISGFDTGIHTAGASITNLVSHENIDGILFAHGTLSSINYCTVVRNSRHAMYAASPHAAGYAINSIFVQNGSHLFYVLGYYGCVTPSGWDYCDTWNNGSGAYGCVSVGSHVASFDPFFVDAASGDFHLDPASIFYDYSNSGGQIGAYGPGPGRPVPAHNVSWGRLKTLYR